MLPKVVDSARCDDSSSLSLRMSCDRCRFQKVKCSVSAGAKECQRCTRARVSCTFGRRAPSKRSSRRAEQTATQPPSPPPTASPLSPRRSAASPPPNTGQAASTLSTSSSSVSPIPVPPSRHASTPDTQQDAVIASRPVPSAALDHEASSCDSFSATWDGSALELYGLTSTLSERGSDMDMADFDWLEQPVFALDEGSTFETGQSEFTAWSQLPPSIPTSGWPTAGSSTINHSTTSIDMSHSAVTTGQRLTSLVSEIEQQLRKLEEGPWQTDSAHSLHDYPVGTILELSQKFSAIAGSILTSTVCINGGVEEGGNDEDHVERTADCGTTGDTPTMLLVMCGYIWLVRIYGVVLGHFQKHLHRMPTGDPRHLGTSTGSISPIAHGASTKLRLGELPCTDVALSLQQIHTAVRMLLDVLHEIEGHLGRGAVAACDMAVALLLNAGRPQNGSSRGLGVKAAAVKKLLREKMGL